MLSLLDNDDETYYELLSPEKRLELDNLRSRAILRHLNRFTLVCEHEYLHASYCHMICNNRSSSQRPPYLTFDYPASNQLFSTLIVIEKGEHAEASRL